MQAFILGSFVFFTGLVAVGTYILTRKDRHDTSDAYFLAGRSLTAGYIAGSLLLTNLSTEQLVGLNGLAYLDGLSVMAWEVVAGLSLVVMALFFLPRYLKSGIATVPEFLEERFDSRTRAITTVIFIVAYAAILLPMVLYTGATGLMGILDVSGLLGTDVRTTLWLMVWMIGIIGSIYAIFGGLRTVAVSDTLNGIGLLAGGLLITWLGLRAVNSDGMFAALNDLREAHPQKFNSLGGPEQNVPFSTLFTGVLLLNLFYWCTNQQIIQRTFGASSLAEGQRGVLLAGLFKILAPIILVLPGVIAFHLYARQEIRPDDAYGMLVREVLPAPLTGFFAAVVVGAILSSFNSALNSTATLFSLGVYKSIFNPNATEAQVIRSGKACGWIVAIASMTVAPLLFGQTSIFAYLQKMNGLYFIPIFSIVVVGIVSRRVPASAANWALIVGVVAIALGYLLPGLDARLTEWNEAATDGHALRPVAAALGPVVGAVAGGLNAIGEFHFLGIVFALLIGMMLVIGRIAPRETPWVHESSGDVDLTPWRWAVPAGLGLVAIVATIYAYFADLSTIGL